MFKPVCAPEKVCYPYKLHLICVICLENEAKEEKQEKWREEDLESDWKRPRLWMNSRLAEGRTRTATQVTRR